MGVLAGVLLSAPETKFPVTNFRAPCEGWSKRQSPHSPPRHPIAHASRSPFSAGRAGPSAVHLRGTMRGQPHRFNGWSPTRTPRRLLCQYPRHGRHAFDNPHSPVVLQRPLSIHLRPSGTAGTLSRPRPTSPPPGKLLNLTHTTRRVTAFFPLNSGPAATKSIGTRGQGVLGGRTRGFGARRTCLL